MKGQSSKVKNQQQSPASEIGSIAPREFARAFAGLLIYTLLPVFIMPLAGNWDWTGAWILLALNIVFGLGGRFIAIRRFPGLLKERARSLQAEDAKGWDKVLVRVVAIAGPLTVLLLAALDKRWNWTMMPSATTLMLGSAITLAGFVLATWALISNPFFSGTVRIQRDRGHHVIESGPYGWMRHPGYAGAIISYLGFPLLLDSWWACAPLLATSAVMAFRTKREDQTLQAELPGYSEYSQRVRYRLLPLIW